ncbi:hypothetical protein MKZ38_010667 [Zalerion maritima]|uniref:Uncharacterized protein n=1 Tax=Zalerion maritima TaxID=339359 RepID=A0AAD5WMT0_9PEZI|nr:hypothetical protein MKZ38_010667 [Zalerion maritima]
MATFLLADLFVATTAYLVDLAKVYSDRSHAEIEDQVHQLQQTKTNGRVTALENKITVATFAPHDLHQTIPPRSHKRPIVTYTNGRAARGYEGGILNHVGRMIRKHTPKPPTPPHSWSSFELSRLELAASTTVAIANNSLPRKRCRIDTDLFVPSAILIDPSTVIFSPAEELQIAKRQVAHERQMIRDKLPQYPTKRSMFPRVDKFEHVSRKRTNNGELVVRQQSRKFWLMKMEYELDAEQETVDRLIRQRLVNLDPETLLQVQFPHEYHTDLSRISEYTEPMSPRRVVAKIASPQRNSSTGSIPSLQLTAEERSPSKLDTSFIDYDIMFSPSSSMIFEGSSKLGMSSPILGRKTAPKKRSSLGAHYLDNRKRLSFGATTTIKSSRRRSFGPNATEKEVDETPSTFNRRHTFHLEEISEDVYDDIPTWADLTNSSPNAIRNKSADSFLEPLFSFASPVKMPLIPASPDALQPAASPDAAQPIESPVAIESAEIPEAAEPAQSPASSPTPNVRSTHKSAHTISPDPLPFWPIHSGSVSPERIQHSNSPTGVLSRRNSPTPQANNSPHKSSRSHSPAPRPFAPTESASVTPKGFRASNQSDPTAVAAKSLIYEDGTATPQGSSFTAINKSPHAQGKASPLAKSPAVKSPAKVTQSPRQPLGPRSPNSPAPKLLIRKRKAGDENQLEVELPESKNKILEKNPKRRRVLRSRSSKDEATASNQEPAPAPSEERIKSLRKRKAPAAPEPEPDTGPRRSSRLPTPASASAATGTTKSRRPPVKRRAVDKFAEALEAETKANTQHNKQGSVSAPDKIKWLKRREEVGDTSPVKKRAVPEAGAKGKGVKWPEEDHLEQVQEFSDEDPAATKAEASRPSTKKRGRRPTAASVAAALAERDSEDELSLPEPAEEKAEQPAAKTKRAVAKGTGARKSALPKATAAKAAASAPLKRAGGSKKAPKKAAPASLAAAPRRRGRSAAN